MSELLTGPAGLVIVLILWVVLQRIILPRFGVRT